MSTTSKWGKLQDNQLSASITSEYLGKDVRVRELSIFGLIVRKAHTKNKWVRGDFSTVHGDIIPDDYEAFRWFKYTCGLIKAINVLSGKTSRMTIYLDGYRNQSMEIEQTGFRFDPDLKDEPKAEIRLCGTCTRHASPKYSGLTTGSVMLVFKDMSQMKEYVIATTVTPDPDRKTVSVQSSSDCFWPLVAGVVIGSALD